MVALVVTAVFSSTTHAAPPPAKESPFGTKSYGDGGGYKHPDEYVDQYMQDAPKGPPIVDKIQTPAKVVPEIKPADPVAETGPIGRDRTRPRPFARAVTKADAPSRPLSSRPDEKARNSSVFAKTGETPKTAGAQADVHGVAEDAAAEQARDDFGAKLLGQAPGAKRPGLAGLSPAPAKPELAAAAPALAAKTPPAPGPDLAVPTSEGMLFVSLELDPKEAGSLRDAVAGLGAAAAFKPDARFDPLASAGGGVRISGWLPASRLGDAIARRGVTRVSVERGSRPAGDTRVTGDFVVQLRVSDPAKPEESVAASVREMGERGGFKLDRVYGVESLPGGGATAVVTGTMPLSQLSRVMGLPDVIKISSTIPADDAPAAPAPKKEGFVQYVMGRGLWLVLLTVFLALPTVAEAVKNGLSVFVPYR